MLAARILVSFLRVYQWAISPLLPQGSCRFYPSCSQYAIDAIAKHGAIRGIVRAIVRVSKCHPFHPGGVDPA